MDAIKNLGVRMKQGVLNARDSLVDGWQELLKLSSGALTRFDVTANNRKDAEIEQKFPQWSLLAAETWETAQSVIVRVEMPGMDLNAIKVSFNAGELHIQGEKRSSGGHAGRTYGLTERAYGRFERRISLAQGVTRSGMEVSYREGVLTVILPKTIPIPPHRDA